MCAAPQPQQTAIFSFASVHFDAWFSAVHSSSLPTVQKNSQRHWKDVRKNSLKSVTCAYMQIGANMNGNNKGANRGIVTNTERAFYCF